MFVLCLGLLSSLILAWFYAYGYWHRFLLEENWKNSQEFGGRLFFFCAGDKNHETLILEIKHGTGLDLRIRPETFVDRFFKKIGISVESQFHDEELDQALYLIMDSEPLADQIALDPEFKEALKNLLIQLQNQQLKLKKLHIAYGSLQLEVEIQGDKPQKANFVEWFHSRIKEALLPCLYRLEQETFVLMQRAHLPKDPFIFRACLILSLNTSVVIFGGVQLFGWCISDTTQLIFDFDPCWHSLILTLIYVFFIGWLTILFLERTSRAHIVLCEVVFMGSFFAFTSFYALLVTYNVSYDTTPSVIEEGPLHSRQYKRGGRKTPDRYYVVINYPSLSGRTGQCKLEVSAHVYESLYACRIVSVESGRGRLGYPYIKSIKNKISY